MTLIKCCSMFPVVQQVFCLYFGSTSTTHSVWGLLAAGARARQGGQLTRASLRQDLKASMSRLRASSGQGSAQLSGDAMRESLSLFLQLEGSASDEGHSEEVYRTSPLVNS